MEINNGASSPRKGMNRDSLPSELKPEEYSLALNADIHDEHGSGKFVVQNEPSNIKCTSFKPGFKVVGKEHYQNSNVTYFFLVNPDTGVSEIGYVPGNAIADGLTPNVTTVDGNLRAVLETPLEQTTQEDSCEYFTIISDYCELTQTATGCLGFSLDSPIRTIVVKEEKTGTTIYWTDYNKAQRYLQLGKLEQYTQDVDPCTGEVTPTCLQCDKMRIFPLHDKFCLHPRIIQNGGNLKAGNYEIIAAACDSQGNELTNYYSMTNPIPVHDKNNNILDQTNLDYITGQAIGIDVIDFDTRFEYFKIVVIYRSGLDSSVTSFVNGVYPSDQMQVTIYTLTDKIKIPLPDVLQRRPYYTKARGMTQSNGYLYQYGLEQHREVNLQLLGNLLGSLGRWVTVRGPEDLYENGVFVSNFQSYMRDEVYPIALQLFEDGGYELPLITLIPRPPFPFEIEVLDAPGSTFVSNTNTDSVLQFNPDCSENLRNQRWQFENTATAFEDVCLVPVEGEDVVTEERFIESQCVISDSNGDAIPLDQVPSGSVAIETSQNIVDYVNTHIEQIKTTTDPDFADIQTILNNPGAYEENCTPEFGSNCSEEIELVSEEMFAIDSTASESEVIEKDLGDYSNIESPDTCRIYFYEEDGVTPDNDTTFETLFMDSGETVYQRQTPSNLSCGSAMQLPTLTTVPSSVFLRNKGEVNGFTSLQTGLDSSATDLNFIFYLSGTSGTANILIGAYTYPVVFNTDLATTASDFVTANATSILSDTGLTVTSNLDSLNFTGNYVLPSFSNTSGDLDAEVEYTAFTDKVHSNAAWLKGTFASGPDAIFQISATNCEFSDDNSGNRLRITIFQDCSQTGDIPSYTRIVSDVTSLNDLSKIIQLDAVDFAGTGSNFYIAIDSELFTRKIAANYISTLRPPCGCFSAYQREVETYTLVNFTNLTFGKRQVWRSLCAFTIPVESDCEPTPYQQGLFSYWESTQEYPCNPELYDSSSLIIPVDAIPIDYRAEFESYYVSGTAGGNYVLNSNANFMGAKIRHYKFPDSTVSPFMSDQLHAPGAFKESSIYPIGFFISNEVINAFLEIGVLNGLLTAEERNRINKYTIFRGDRRIDKSVIAKGLMYDTYKYTDGTETVYYPNYPLNSLGTDKLNNNVPHPYNSLGNNLFTFHSPETSFLKPSLPRELSLEAYLYGYGGQLFDEVRDHSTYVILGNGSYNLAVSLAIAEITFEILLQSTTWLLTATSAGTAPGIGISTAAWVAGVAALSVQSLIKFGEYNYKWQETLKNLGKPTNFAYYSVCVGHYNYLKGNTVAGSRLRGLPVSTYINPGRIAVNDETGGNVLKINNIDREASVLVGMGLDSYNLLYPADYIAYVTDVASNSRITYDGTGRSSQRTVYEAAPYVALKQYLPAQYGNISSIEWVHTNFCGQLSIPNFCDPAFGGDTYISRFSLKRKFPFFTSNAMGLPPLLPFKYSDYFNVNPQFSDSRFYVDYLINDDNDNFFQVFLFPNNKSKYNLDSTGTSSPGFYVKLPNKFYLFSYGIPYFLVESEINCNYRYAKRELKENFYPNVGDVIDWTQEKNVSIKEPNEYFYNMVYSAGHTVYPWRLLPSNFNREDFDKLNNLQNAAIYSKQDVSQNSLTDPWLVYKALDFFDFPKSFGNLIELVGIESEQILSRFVNGFSIFGSVDVIADRLTPETKNLGTGGIFQGRVIDFNKTDLGYAGSQHFARVSCQFGHFWVDARRGKVFQLLPGGAGLEEISKGNDDYNAKLEKWFKENLPFKILQMYPEIEDTELDNNFRGIGIAMGWDDRRKRVFITKKDYVPIEGVCYSNGHFYNTNGHEQQIIQMQDLGYTYEGVDDDRCRLRFTIEINGNTVEQFIETNEVRLGDTRFFEECSFTVAYNPEIKAWVSYYSFKPDYYVSHNNYFQTGLNFSNTQNEIGLWSHLSFLSSYQVFYGRIYPFLVEFPLVPKGVDSVLHSVRYWMDVEKYYSKYDRANIYGTGFNKAIIWNNQQNSGLLNLVHHNPNDMRQMINFPRYNPSSIDILQSEIDGLWSFNYLYNIIKDERSGLPVWLQDCNQILKDLNTPLLDYRYIFHDRLRGDWFSCILINDVESRFKMRLRFNVDKRGFYDQ